MTSIKVRAPFGSFEIQTEVTHKNKTYAEIVKEVGKSNIATYEIIQYCRNNKLHDCFNDFWVFVPNPDKISKDNGYIAWFGAGLGGAVLCCNWDPTDVNASLGVFVIRNLKLKVGK